MLRATEPKGTKLATPALVFEVDTRALSPFVQLVGAERIESTARQPTRRGQ